MQISSSFVCISRFTPDSQLRIDANFDVWFRNRPLLSVFYMSVLFLSTSSHESEVMLVSQVSCSCLCIFYFFDLMTKTLCRSSASTEASIVILKKTTQKILNTSFLCFSFLFVLVLGLSLHDPIDPWMVVLHLWPLTCLLLGYVYLQKSKYWSYLLFKLQTYTVNVE